MSVICTYNYVGNIKIANLYIVQNTRALTPYAERTSWLLCMKNKYLPPPSRRFNRLYLVINDDTEVTGMREAQTELTSWTDRIYCVLRLSMYN